VKNETFHQEIETDLIFNLAAEAFTAQASCSDMLEYLI